MSSHATRRLAPRLGAIVVGAALAWSCGGRLADDGVADDVNPKASQHVASARCGSEVEEGAPCADEAPCTRVDEAYRSRTFRCRGGAWRGDPVQAEDRTPSRPRPPCEVSACPPEPPAAGAPCASCLDLRSPECAYPAAPACEADAGIVAVCEAGRWVLDAGACVSEAGVEGGAR